MKTEFARAYKRRIKLKKIKLNGKNKIKLINDQAVNNEI